MNKTRSELRAEARKALDGSWLMGVAIILIYILITGVAQVFGMVPFVGWAFSLAFALLIVPVLSYGMANLFLDVRRGAEADLGNLFAGFKQYGHVLGGMLLMVVYTFLWTLLLVVPGIVKSYSYALTPYLLRDDPTLGADEAICKSMAMMKGHKMRLFLLDLSFIGWALLAMLLTLGIGMLWVVPYMQTARAAFYDDLTGTAASPVVDAFDKL